MPHRLRELAEPLRLPGFRAVWLAGLLSEAGDWAARLALGFLVLETTGSVSATAAVLSLSFLAWLGPGQLLATLGDRHDRRTVLLAADLLRGVAFLALALGPPLEVVVGLVLLSGLATPAFDAARAAVVPQVVPREQLPAASLLAGATEELAVVAGTLGGGALVALAGPTAALALNGATFVLSAWLLRVLPRGLGGHTAVAGRLRQAARVVARTPAVRRAVLLVAAAMGPATAGTTLLTPYVVREVGGGAGTVSLLTVVAGAVCVLVTTLLVPRSADTAVQLRACALLVLAGAPLVLVFAVAPSVPGVLLPVAGLGVLAVVLSPASALVAPLLPDEVRASAFGVLTGVLCASQAATTLIAGALAGSVGTGAALAATAVPGLLLAAWFLARPLPTLPAAVPDRALAVAA